MISRSCFVEPKFRGCPLEPGHAPIADALGDRGGWWRGFAEIFLLATPLALGIPCHAGSTMTAVRPSGTFSTADPALRLPAHLSQAVFEGLADRHWPAGDGARGRASVLSASMGCTKQLCGPPIRSCAATRRDLPYLRHFAPSDAAQNHAAAGLTGNTGRQGHKGYGRCREAESFQAGPATPPIPSRGL